MKPDKLILVSPRNEKPIGTFKIYGHVNYVNNTEDYDELEKLKIGENISYSI